MSLRWRSLQFNILGSLVGLVSLGLIAQFTLGIPLRWLPLFEPPIQQLQARSHSLDGRTVYLRGVINDSAPLIQQRVYELQDETGTVWVLSSEQTLQTGDEIFLKGRVRYQSIPIAGQDMGSIYIEARKLLEINGVSVGKSSL